MSSLVYPWLARDSVFASNRLQTLSPLSSGVDFTATEDANHNLTVTTFPTQASGDGVYFVNKIATDVALASTGTVTSTCTQAGTSGLQVLQNYGLAKVIHYNTLTVGGVTSPYDSISVVNKVTGTSDDFSFTATDISNLNTQAVNDKNTIDTAYGASGTIQPELYLYVYFTPVSPPNTQTPYNLTGIDVTGPNLVLPPPIGSLPPPAQYLPSLMDKNLATPALSVLTGTYDDRLRQYLAGKGADPTKSTPDMIVQLGGNPDYWDDFVRLNL